MINASETREVVRGYFDAWTGGDVAAAADYLADDLTFRGSIDSFDAAADYLATLERFRQTVTGVELISELYSDGEATLIYDVDTATPAGTIRTAEHLRVDDDRVRSITLIFDASELRQLMPAAQSS